MINWLHLLYNLLWIVGLAIIVAALSYVNWLAGVRRERLRTLLGQAVFQFPFNVGLTMVSLGLFFLERGRIERIVWGVFALLFAWQAWALRGPKSR